MHRITTSRDYSQLHLYDLDCSSDELLCVQHLLNLSVRTFADHAAKEVVADNLWLLLRKYLVYELKNG